MLSSAFFLATANNNSNFFLRMLSKLLPLKKPSRLRPLMLPTLVLQRNAVKEVKPLGPWSQLMRAGLLFLSFVKRTSSQLHSWSRIFFSSRLNTKTEGISASDLRVEGSLSEDYPLSTSCAIWDLAEELREDVDTSSLPFCASCAAWCSPKDEDSLSEDSDDTEELVTPTGSPVLGSALDLPVETFKIVIHEVETRDVEEDPNFGKVINTGPLKTFSLPVWRYIPPPQPSFGAPRPGREQVSFTPARRPLPIPPV